MPTDSEVKSVDRKCVNHCGHDTKWMRPDGLCHYNYAVVPAPSARWKETHCGHRCTFPPDQSANHAPHCRKWAYPPGEQRYSALCTCDASGVPDQPATHEFIRGIPGRDGRYFWRSKECPEPSEVEVFSNQRYVMFPNLVSIESSEAFKEGEFKYIGELERDSADVHRVADTDG